MTAHRRIVGLVLAGAVLISFSAIFFALSGASPVVGSLFRMVYALPFLLVLAWVRRHDDHRTVQERLLAGLAGVFLAIDLFAWFAAIEWIGAGLATLIANAQVLIVPLATWAIFHERPGPAVLAATVPALGGLALISGLGRSDSFGSRPVLGVLVGMVAAVLYSAFLVVFRRSNRRLAPAAAPMLDVTIGAGVTSAIAAVIVQADVRPVAPGHWWLLGMALTGHVIGWTLISYALPRLDAAATSFAIVLQPTLTLIWGRLIFDETPSGVQLLGVAIVWTTIAYVVTRRQAPPALAQSAASA